MLEHVLTNPVQTEDSKAKATMLLSILEKQAHLRQVYKPLSGLYLTVQIRHSPYLKNIKVYADVTTACMSITCNDL